MFSLVVARPDLLSSSPPQDALKKLGLKIRFDDKGESEVVEREGAEVADVSGAALGGEGGQGYLCSVSAHPQVPPASITRRGALLCTTRDHPHRIPIIPIIPTQDADFMLNLNGDHKARVAAFVADLMDDDEDEAEIPMRAMRRPRVAL